MEIDEISKFIAPLTVGFIDAYLGSLLALRKFKREKIWDERRSIYKEVIESFEEIIFWCEYVRASHCGEPVIEGDVDFDSSLRKIARHSVSGGLFSSSKFQEVLKQAHAELYQVRFQINEESLPDLDTDRGRKEWLFILSKEIRSVSKKYLDQLINLAKDELPNLT
ncbi:hypothetical protein [Shewanella algae]|uniref:hypothetical protein n=1 Tax=Shewanella algae TaxID=38313 RepID=UPI000C31F280|nr:hypothetical protein [Shewanella algae]MBO2641729.1 hypothetical protein [Shewanella algae]